MQRAHVFALATVGAFVAGDNRQAIHDHHGVRRTDPFTELASIASFDLYEGWLAQGNGPHTSAIFRRWMTDTYCPGPYPLAPIW